MLLPRALGPAKPLQITAQEPEQTAHASEEFVLSHVWAHAPRNPELGSLFGPLIYIT